MGSFGGSKQKKLQVYLFFGLKKDLVKMQADGKRFRTNGSFIYIYKTYICNTHICNISSPIGIYLISGKTKTHLVYNSLVLEGEQTQNRGQRGLRPEYTLTWKKRSL